MDVFPVNQQNLRQELLAPPPPPPPPPPRPGLNSSLHSTIAVSVQSQCPDSAVSSPTVMVIPWMKAAASNTLSDAPVCLTAEDAAASVASTAPRATYTAATCNGSAPCMFAVQQCHEQSYGSITGFDADTWMTSTAAEAAVVESLMPPGLSVSGPCISVASGAINQDAAQLQRLLSMQQQQPQLLAGQFVASNRMFNSSACNSSSSETFPEIPLSGPIPAVPPAPPRRTVSNGSSSSSSNSKAGTPFMQQLFQQHQREVAKAALQQQYSCSLDSSVEQSLRGTTSTSTQQQYIAVAGPSWRSSTQLQLQHGQLSGTAAPAAGASAVHGSGSSLPSSSVFGYVDTSAMVQQQPQPQNHSTAASEAIKVLDQEIPRLLLLRQQLSDAAAAQSCQVSMPGQPLPVQQQYSSLSVATPTQQYDAMESTAAVVALAPLMSTSGTYDTNVTTPRYPVGMSAANTAVAGAAAAAQLSMIQQHRGIAPHTATLLKQQTWQQQQQVMMQGPAAIRSDDSLLTLRQLQAQLARLQDQQQQQVPTELIRLLRA